MGGLDNIITFGGEDITVRRLIEMLVPGWDGKKIDLTVQDVRNAVPQIGEMESVKTEGDLEESFHTIRRGKTVKDTVSGCLNYKHVAFESKVFNNMDRKQIILVFFELFSVTPKQAAEDKDSGVVSPEKETPTALQNSLRFSITSAASSPT